MRFLVLTGQPGRSQYRVPIPLAFAAAICVVKLCSCAAEKVPFGRAPTAVWKSTEAMGLTSLVMLDVANVASGPSKK